MENKKNILILLNDTGYGGVQEFVLSLCKFSKHNLFLFRLTSGELENEFNETGITILGGRNFEENLDKYIEEFKISIVHANNAGGNWPGYMNIATKKVPTLENIHCVRVGCEQEANLTKIVASKYNESIQKYKNNLFVIPYPLSTWKYFRVEKKVDNTVNIGRLGNITGLKVPLDFIYAAEELIKKSNKNLKFYLWGNQKQDKLLSQLCLKKIKELGLEKKIIMESIISYEKFNKLQTLDIFLYPTTKESYCISIIEAMFCEVPIVSYNNSAVPEVVGEGGLLSPTGDINKLVDNTLLLINDIKLRKNLGKRGREIVMKRNLPEKIINFYDNIYSSL